MGSKKLIIAVVMLTCVYIGLFTIVDKNENVQAKSLQQKVVQDNVVNNKNIFENSCYRLDKQVQEKWRALNLESQTTGYLYRAEQDNKWGFIDSEGKYKILPQYDYVTLFSPSGTAICGNYGEDKNKMSAKIIDKSGNIVLDGIVMDEYSVGYPGNRQAFDNYFEVFKLENGKNAIVDQTGKIIYSTTEELGGYSEGFVAEGNSAYINVSRLIDGESNFKIILPKKYKELWNFSHKYAELQVDNEQSEYMDENGKIYKKEPKGYMDLLDKNDYIADEMHDEFYALADELREDGYKIIKSEVDGSTSFGITTLDGKRLLAAKYDQIKYLGEGMFALGQGGNTYRYSEYRANEYEFIFDAQKLKLYNAHYYMLQRYYDGVAAASDLKNSFFIDREGKRATGYPVFDKVGQLTRIGGLIMQRVHGRVSYYQKSGIEIYSQEDPRTILKDKMGYISTSTYRRFDFGLEYPDFFGLSNSSAQKKINDAAKKMNEEVYKAIITDDPKLVDYDIFHDELNVSINGNLLMVKYMADTNGGGTLCIPYIMSQYFDVRTGQSYDLSSMFKVGISYKKELVKKVIALYGYKKLFSLLWSQGDSNELEKFLSDGNFYIAEDGIIISEFPDGSSNYLISYAKLKIPYTNIMSMINTKSELWNSFEKRQSKK